MLKRIINKWFYPKGTWFGSRCSGHRVYPDGKKCGGCSDCRFSLDVHNTTRGFGITYFKDFNGEYCSIQESSRVEPPLLWLGVDEHRMHIDKHTAKELVILLNHFIKTDELP